MTGERKTGKNPLKPLAGVLITLAVIGGIIFAGAQWLRANSGKTHADTVTVVHLKENSPFRIKKRSEVMNHEVFRITSTRQPQEFLVLSRVNPRLVDPVFGKTPSKALVNTIANQVLASASTSGNSEGGGGPTVDIQQVKTVRSGTVRVDGKPVPYWQLQVQFKLSTEDYPREYEAAVMRQPGGDGKERLTISFAQENVFQQELMTELAKNISLEELSAD